MEAASLKKYIRKANRWKESIGIDIEEEEIETELVKSKGNLPKVKLALLTRYWIRTAKSTGKTLLLDDSDIIALENLVSRGKEWKPMYSQKKLRLYIKECLMKTSWDKEQCKLLIDGNFT